MSIAPAGTPPSIFDTLCSYADKGFPVVPIFGIADDLGCKCPDGNRCARSRGKHPHRGLAGNGVKNATLDKEVLKDWSRRNVGGNWAIATGQPLPDGGYLVVLDVDPRNLGNETLQDFEERWGPLPDTVREITGGGGAHHLFRSKTPIACRTVGPGLDLKAGGGFIVCSPSRHASGAYYIWDAGGHPDETVIADAPEWLLHGTTSDRDRPQWTGKGARDTLLGEAFHLAGLLGEALPGGAYMAKCLWADGHSDGRGFGKDSSTAILPAIEGTSYGSFACRHGSCNHRTWAEVMKALPPAAVHAARLKYPLKPALLKSPPPDTDEGIAVQAVGDPLAHVNSCILWKRTPKGGSYVASDVVNVITILTYDPRWQVDGLPILRFDEFAQQIAFAADPPWHPDDAPSVLQPYWRDEDTTRMMAWFRRNWDVAVPDSMIYQGIQVVARRYSSHPVRTWLNTLTWDGTPRVHTWLTNYLGVKAGNRYVNNVGRWWLISAVARVMKPGCKADHVLILEGPQGINKSTALETLAMKRDWFSDTPFELGTKDSYLALRSRWLVELAELDGMNRSDSARAKAFFSSPSDCFRAPFGRETLTVPRQCVFAGSVNHSSYLKDSSGNRRYWPVACGFINLELLRQDREQIWAEALHMYNAGEKWWPATPEDAKLCAFEQEERGEDADAWQEVIVSWLLGNEAKQLLEDRDALHTPGGYLTTADVLARALRMPNGAWDKASQVRVGKILSVLHWGKARVGKMYVYTFPRDDSLE